MNFNFMPIINTDSELGKHFGFTSDKFCPEASYLWKTDNRITISAIIAKQEGKGYFSELLNKIWQAGYTVAVPTPLPKMEYILTKKGFKKTQEDDCEVWVK